MLKLLLNQQVVSQNVTMQRNILKQERKKLLFLLQVNNEDITIVMGVNEDNMIQQTIMLFQMHLVQQTV